MITSYSQFLRKIKSYGNIPLPINEELDQLSRLTPAFLADSSTIFYCIHYGRQEFRLLLAATNEVFGYPLTDFQNKGPQILLDICHPNDRQVIDEHIFPDICNHLNKSPATKRKNLNFSITYRIKTRDGQLRQVNQFLTFLTLEREGLPIASLGMLNDISLYKTSESLVLSINDRSTNNSMGNIVNYYHPSDIHLSNREIEILKWVANGLSSKQIADKLNISIHTVNNHRKNLLFKTGCRNISELLTHTMKQGWF